MPYLKTREAADQDRSAWLREQKSSHFYPTKERFVHPVRCDQYRREPAASCQSLSYNTDSPPTIPISVRHEPLSPLGLIFKSLHIAIAWIPCTGLRRLRVILAGIVIIISCRSHFTVTCINAWMPFRLVHGIMRQQVHICPSAKVYRQINMVDFYMGRKKPDSSMISKVPNTAFLMKMTMIRTLQPTSTQRIPINAIQRFYPIEKYTDN